MIKKIFILKITVKGNDLKISKYKKASPICLIHLKLEFLYFEKRQQIVIIQKIGDILFFVSVASSMFKSESTRSIHGVSRYDRSFRKCEKNKKS